MIDLVIYPLGRGVFRVECDGRLICGRTDQPLLDGARVLQAEGVSQGALVSMRHAGSEHRSLTSTVGAAAKLTISETPGEGPRFAPYRPYSRTVASPSDFEGGSVSD